MFDRSRSDVSSWVMVMALALPTILSGCPLDLPPTQVIDPGFYGEHDVGFRSEQILGIPAIDAAWVHDVYFPSLDGETIDPAAKPCPVIYLVPGLNLSPWFYRSYGEQMASWGYVVVMPYVIRFDNYQAIEDVSAHIDFLEGEVGRSGSFYEGAVDLDKIGLTGHSMGGKYAVMGLFLEDRIKTSVGLDPTYIGIGDNSTWPDVNPVDLALITEPLLMIGAPKPSFFSPEGTTMYDIYNAATGPTQVVGVTGASHVSFVDDNDLGIYDFLHFGTGVSLPDSDSVHTITERYMVSWFNVFLRGQTEYETYIYGAEADQDVADGLVTIERNFVP
jgi:hypothetical protein